MGFQWSWGLFLFVFCLTMLLFEIRSQDGAGQRPGSRRLRIFLWLAGILAGLTLHVIN